MNPRVTLRKALEDPALLGEVLGGDTWHTWRTFFWQRWASRCSQPSLRPSSGSLAARHHPRTASTSCGAASAVAAVRAVQWLHSPSSAGLCDYSDKLSPGERGVVLLLAPDMKQAKVLLGYAEGTLESTPIMKQLLASRTAETLTLTTGITLEVRNASFRRIRGVTCVAVLADECAFWMSDESANPAVEILNAARPALATTQGPLIAISSPYARRGALWDIYKRHFGPQGDPMILVAQGATRDFNPDLPQSIIDRAMERDAAAANAEYMAQFRTDVEAFITREAVEECVKQRLFERPPERKHNYIAFVDPSGGSSDAMTVAIAHTEGKTQIL